MNIAMFDDIEVRKSTRAKSLHIKITNYGKVIVVVPNKARRIDIDKIVENNRSWINDRLAHVAKHRKILPENDKPIPNNISLALINRAYTVEYQFFSKKNSVIEKDQTLCVLASDEKTASAAIRGWLQKKAKGVLTTLLEEESRRLNLPYNKVTIRGQKTRWGSCSLHKNISLNRNLLFLQEILVRYLMIHELCHTKHLNHSRDYWHLVQSLEPNFKDYEKSLSHAYVYVPKWAIC